MKVLFYSIEKSVSLFSSLQNKAVADLSFCLTTSSVKQDKPLPDLIIFDFHNSDQLSELNVLKRVYNLSPLIVLLKHEQFHLRSVIVDVGVSDVILNGDIEKTSDRIIEVMNYYEKSFLIADGKWFGNFCLPGRGVYSKKMSKMIMVAAKSDESILIIGETGTGKDILAKEIHSASARCLHPYLPFNCASVPPGLLSGELFGSVKGAFTGAVSNVMGKLGGAGDGTLFLDELGELSLEGQVKLLRVLESREYLPLGSNIVKPFRARVIAAANQTMSNLKANRIRMDLFYRLAVFVIEIPPLRDHLDDIPIFISQFCREFKSQKYFSSNAIEKMLAYNWPGNIRQLRNVVIRCILVTSGEVISAGDVDFA